jgi:hypothetical protein
VATVSHFLVRWSGYVSDAPLGFSFNGSLWLCWQLQNCGLLALTQCCQEHDPTIRKFQRIVMRRNLASVDLPKDRCLMLDHFTAPDDQASRQAPNLLRKRQLRTRKDADGYFAVLAHQPNAN